MLALAGMTIKFFGLFFYERCGLSPVAVSLLATVAPFLVSGASFTAQWLSKWCVNHSNLKPDSNEHHVHAPLPMSVPLNS